MGGPSLQTNQAQARGPPGPNSPGVEKRACVSETPQLNLNKKESIFLNPPAMSGRPVMRDTKEMS